MYLTEWSMVEEPEQFKYITELTIFYQDVKREEDNYVFLPALRRSLRPATTARCAPFGGGDFTKDDNRAGFNGGISVFDAQFLRDHGRVPGDVQFFNTEVAFKYKMSSMQAALGLAQLERIDELVQRKRDIFTLYRRAFIEADGIALNAEPKGTKNSYWMITAVWGRDINKTKNEIILKLRDAGVGARPFFHPLSSLPAFAGLARVEESAQRNVVSYDIASRAINLPSGFSLTPTDVGRVRGVLLDALGA